jgi:alpha-mannosidase
MMKAQQQSGHDLGFKLRFGVPSQFDAAVAARRGGDLPVFKGELNPIFQGTYSSRVELKQAMRERERLLTTAEMLGVLADWTAPPKAAVKGGDDDPIWQAWEPVLFNQTHDLASGVMTDHVYEDVVRELDFARRFGEGLVDERWERLTSAIDTRGAEGVPLVVLNTLGWARTDVAEATIGFTAPGVSSVAIIDPSGANVPVQVLSAVRGRDQGIREARIAFLARDVPAVGYAVYHAVPRSGSPATATELLVGKDDAGGGGDAGADAVLENEHCRVVIDRFTGAIARLELKADGWNALSGPANVIARQEDKGDLWELYHGLDGGSRFAMTAVQPVPRAGATTKLSTDFKSESPGVVRIGPVFAEFTLPTHPCDNGKLGATIRLARGSHRVEIATRLTNGARLVRYQALFPTSIADGRNVQSIAFGACQRPVGIEFPAQDWVDWGDADHGVGLLNIGLCGNLVSERTLMLSLLRAHTLANYGFGGGFEPGMTSDSGYEIDRERTLRYALVPHRGDWRQAQVYREGMEFGRPLLCRPAAAHAGSLPATWGWVQVSEPSVVVSALQAGSDGAALLRVYETIGKATNVTLTFAAELASANEVNLMADTMAAVKPDGKRLSCDIGAFQIKTLKVRLARPPAQ